MKLFASLRSRILLAILLAVVPLLIFVIDGYRSERAAAIAAIDEDIRILLRTALLKESEVANTIRLTLGIMSRANDMLAPDPDACFGLARRLSQSQPNISNMGAAWPDGTLFCSARPALQAMNVADRTWFKEVLATRAFTKGQYVKGRVSGLATVVYGSPQFSETGEVRAALFAGVTLDWFNQAIEGVRIPAGWHAKVVTADGTVAAEVAPGNVPHTHSPEEIIRILGTLPGEPVVHQIALPDGIHLTGVAPLPSTHGLYLLIGTDAASVLAPVNQRLTYQLLLILAVALLSLLIAWRAMQSVIDWTMRMVEAMLGFGLGQLDTRVGTISKIKELQTLTDSFDAMAERIETMNDELEERVAARTAALARSNAELEAFAYSVSHDLRAPLRAVSGFGEILSERYRAGLDAEGQRYLDNVKSAAEHMNHLIDDLLQYARVGRSAVKIETVALAPLLQDIAMLFQPRLKNGGRIEITAPLATPMGDPRLIEQILANLLDNALKYQPAGQTPMVRVSAVLEGDSVAIRVADNGIGIAPEHREKIFAVFQRLHNEEEYPGTGIGLAIVQKAARLMNGTLAVESAPGRGSTFTLRLPAARQASE
ncbi:MAG: ATP-binding protein [Rhodocyclaceae bacterium]|nr:ATP-binding protein [Rhodocyclaceae bacterium]